MKTLKIKEEAVSPVIGVMLMLVVTIVLAAVITTFATGLAGDSTSTTPMALLEADNQQTETQFSYEMNGKETFTNLLTFDIVHKGGDEMVLENIQVTLEPFGGKQHGIMVIRNGNNEKHMTVLGEEKEKLKTKAIVSTGDRIRVNVWTDESSGLERMKGGVTVKWTVSDIRTTGVIAKGEFVVPGETVITPYP